MRTFLSGLATIVAVVAIVLAVPAVWVSQRIVDDDGFTSLIEPVGHDQAVKDYLAGEITEQIASRTSISGADAVVRPLANAYTNSSQFPADFADVATQQHQWLFDEASDPNAPMQLDITAMVNRVLENARLGVSVSGPITIPISNGDTGLHAGAYHQAGEQITTIAKVSVIAGIIAAIIALLVARRRGTVIAWLGIATLLAGVVCWAVANLYGAYLKNDVSSSENTAKPVADVAIDTISHELQWTGVISMLVGAGILVFGIVIRLAFGGRR
ncbi:hypothetical protein [Gordonia aichiensis]|uniref:Uncharacterized protein n=1 Tax=Gordonia aichiensis NBRC 108223 TaxID=1220583 RepID=L7KGV7_9ACTN|nr:hypothetical protein [Gordonia aichiensis]GAC47854.1 hypothetical protein GOACH_04_02510 [Gordonia aichiensis NBRC 108223]